MAAKRHVACCLVQAYRRRLRFDPRCINMDMHPEVMVTKQTVRGHVSWLTRVFVGTIDKGTL
jgi:hypothetical protein